MVRKLKNFFHSFFALIANIYYGYPSKKICVIGVTGTDGKTTTVNLIHHVLKESGKKAAMISTIGAVIGDKAYDTGFHVTTPSSFQIQKYIKEAVGKGCEYLVLEVTSHALDQNRVFGIDFKIGVLTNITHEHLDYHKTYEKYAATKAKLLKMAKLAVINRDDESYKIINSKFIHSTSSGQEIQNSKLRTYGIKNDADITPRNFPFKTKLIGEFNKYNILAAIVVARELKLRDEKIRDSIKTFNSPLGRQEIVYDKDFKVMIDFAHTPNAFYEILEEASKTKKNRLIHVFGAASERDITKRPFMGKASSEFSDIIILTSEDPRKESPKKIMSEIQKGIKKEFKYADYNDYIDNVKNSKIFFKIEDRKKAIEFAITLAKEGDFVITTGKSHEKSMSYEDREESWDEFEIVFGALNKRRINTKHKKLAKKKINTSFI